MKKLGNYLSLSAVMLFVLYGAFLYVDFLKTQKDKITFSNYKNQAKNLQDRVSNMILSKQKSTVAMALSIADNKKLEEDIKNNAITKDYYTHLIEKFKDNTLYKNIWIQILDKNLVSQYRSWSDKRGDNLYILRSDLRYVLKNKKPAYSVSIGRFDLSIKAMVPIFSQKEIIGIVEIISHFNSIDRQLQLSNVSSLVIADKVYKDQILYPFTKIFMDDYYIANFDAKKEDMDYLKKHNVRNFLNESYRVENSKLIVSYPLKDKQGIKIGYFVMFQDLKHIHSADMDFFMFKWIAVATIIVMAIMLIVTIVLFKLNRNQKYYYKNIINSSTNIVIVSDKQKIISVNNTFFKYFAEFKTIDDFKKKYKCICDMFEECEGYLQADMNGVNWVDYVLAHQDKVHKIKVKYSDKEYYFNVGVSLVDEEKDYYSVILTDITKEELYQIKLEYISITDSLTNIKNRRFFQEKIEDEISSSNRYGHPLALIMFDIDHFKKINDEHGHAVGDDVLVEYTKLISLELRASDTFCRIGGEEFIIILPYADKDNAYRIAQKLRGDIESYKKILPVTMSFGVVEYCKDEDTKGVLKRLDDALYKAKETGRNKVVQG